MVAAHDEPVRSRNDLVILWKMGTSRREYIHEKTNLHQREMDSFCNCKATILIKQIQQTEKTMTIQLLKSEEQKLEEVKISDIEIQSKILNMVFIELNNGYVLTMSVGEWMKIRARVDDLFGVQNKEKLNREYRKLGEPQTGS